MLPITGLGSNVRALNTEQHKNPELAIEVPRSLLEDCDEKHKDVLANSVKRATNLYRRVSTVSYRSNDDGGVAPTAKYGSKCMVCAVTLVKSSKDRERAGVKLRCGCNARVCTTCFYNNPRWYMSEPHHSTCSTLAKHICSTCSLFHRVVTQRCCRWMCSGCASANGDCCLACNGNLKLPTRAETQYLWVEDTRSSSVPTVDQSDESLFHETSTRYKEAVARAITNKIATTRHMTASNIRQLFGTPDLSTDRCSSCSTDSPDPMCIACTPVLTVMELLSRNPRPIAASLGECVIPGRALTRHTYNRAMLLAMLNDPDLPLCVNGSLCKGMLLNRPDAIPMPLKSLDTPESYNELVRNRSRAQELPQQTAYSCILCVLFNQSAAIKQMLSANKLYLEQHPTGPVYYFNIKLSQDIGLPEVVLDDQYIIQFQGSVGSYKPMFYYKWRDMLHVLRVYDNNITILPVE